MPSSSQRPDSISVLDRHDRYYIDAADLHILVGASPDGRASNSDPSLYLYRQKRHSSVFMATSSLESRRSSAKNCIPPRQATSSRARTTAIPSSWRASAQRSSRNYAGYFTIRTSPNFAVVCSLIPWLTTHLRSRKYSLYEASVDDWNSILNLADKWDFNEVKELAVRELQKKKELDIVTKMALYQKYKVDKRHLVPLYASLCKRDIPLSLGEAHILGMEATILVNTARERLRANPSDGGRSPLPSRLDDGDIFRELESEMGIEEGSTAKFREEHPPADWDPRTLNLSPHDHSSANSCFFVAAETPGLKPKLSLRPPKPGRNGRY